VALLTAYLFIY